MEYYLRFGGGLGLGLGVPVVSYAPRPMFVEAMSSLRIIDKESSNGRNAVAQGTGIELLSQGQRGPDRKSGLEVTSDRDAELVSVVVAALIDSGQPVRRTIRPTTSAGMQTMLFAMCALVETAVNFLAGLGGRQVCAPLSLAVRGRWS
ncbi:hypothetical protein DOTSEDRAFT_39931 [Dothistroma septosporum NZE10]|uniref:Uncharacterized protein n=1 Tax=Dothistroma septosporum (strain NZE10 / CBS 128990) TaxID=675120 RepID=N1PYQ0_DOTSN|nr:hypothetical protein DOTSEDRAFT_39931 [Dothistroma septosporum NZE10]